MFTIDREKVCRIVAAQRGLLAFIRGLTESEQAELVALSWIGRGTYKADEWGEALSEARAAHNGRTAEYLAGLPGLAGLLEKGLAAFGKNCRDIEGGSH